MKTTKRAKTTKTTKRAKTKTTKRAKRAKRAKTTKTTKRAKTTMTVGEFHAALGNLWRIPARLKHIAMSPHERESPWGYWEVSKHGIVFASGVVRLTVSL